MAFIVGPDGQLYTRTKGAPAVTVDGVTVNVAPLDTPQLATKSAAATVTGTDGKYWVKVTKAAAAPTNVKIEAIARATTILREK